MALARRGQDDTGISVGNSRDDSVNGRWTLQVLGSPSPKIKLWKLHLSSRWD